MTEIRLDLTVSEADADDERLDELTVRLLHDLRDLGVESVARRSGGTVPEGAKPGDPFTLGALALVAVPAFLPQLVEFLQVWSLRGESRKVKIKTPAGLEVEFTPDQKLSRQDVLELVEQLTASSQAAAAAPGLSLLTLSYRTQLRQLLSRHFDESELQTLCFDLGVDYDNLPGDGKAEKARELIEYLERRGRIQELIDVGKKLRPDVPWESSPEAT
jgi:hypothetical protein